MRKLWRKLLRFYIWRKYGICPVHLSMARSGGGYEPKWICDACDDENRVKNDNRSRQYEDGRKLALEKMKALERQP